MGKMVKQRQESARAYEEGGRLELAEKELAEIGVIQEFLPRQMDQAEVAAAVDAAVAETGAASIRDVGKVMAALKAKYTGQMDFGAVGALVKGGWGNRRSDGAKMPSCGPGDDQPEGSAKRQRDGGAQLDRGARQSGHDKSGQHGQGRQTDCKRDPAGSGMVLP